MTGCLLYMPYSAFIVIVLVIHIIINFDIFRSKKVAQSMPAIGRLKVFLISIAIFYVADLLWGVFDENKLAMPLYIDTVFYFVTMGATIFFWTRYVVKFLEGQKIFRSFLEIFGLIFFAAELILLIINIFTPVLFRVDLNTYEYKAYLARNIMLYCQIGMYILVFIYTLIFTIKSRGKMMRRNLAICVFSIVTAIFILAQVFNPLLPYYSVGMVVGNCILSSFVVNDIREEYQAALVQSETKEKIQEVALDKAINLAHTDPLTGVKNKHAYVELEDEIDGLIAKKEMPDFALVVCDLNGLKRINDTLGHDMGDKYIIDSVDIIERFFGKEEVYRFGGDEFVVLLKGETYKNRRNLLSSFNQYIDNCLDTNEPIISAGMSTFKRDEDNTLRAVFNRADKLMYARKEMLKEHSDD